MYASSAQLYVLLVVTYARTFSNVSTPSTFYCSIIQQVFGWLVLMLAGMQYGYPSALLLLLLSVLLLVATRQLIVVTSTRLLGVNHYFMAATPTTIPHRFSVNDNASSALCTTTMGTLTSSPFAGCYTSLSAAVGVSYLILHLLPLHGQIGSLLQSTTCIRRDIIAQYYSTSGRADLDSGHQGYSIQQCRAYCMAQPSYSHLLIHLYLVAFIFGHQCCYYSIYCVRYSLASFSY